MPVRTATPTAGVLGLLSRFARVVYRQASEEALGIRLKQLAALDYLRERGGTTQQELGQGMLVDANNCVILLNDLEQAGYVVRRRDPSDRRRHIVEMTPAGAEALAAAERRLQAVEDEVLRNLSAAERAKLRSLLAKALAGHCGE